MATKKATHESTHRIERDPVKYNIVLTGASGTG